MSVHTKTRHTKRTSAHKAKRANPRRSIPWREVFKKELRKYGEAALMLRGSRHKLDLTQKELADALEIPQNHISEMENGKRPIGKRTALKLGKFFKTDYRKFL
ncbi:MAG: helix-turn-helix transcriptional regulator [Rhabdochlamydiaceae bacterium]